MRALLVLVGVFACLAVLHVTVADETALAKREVPMDSATAEDDHKEETAMTGEKEDDEEKAVGENVGTNVMGPGGRVNKKKGRKMARKQERKERKQEMKKNKKEGRRNKKKDFTPEERQALREKKRQMKKERKQRKKGKKEGRQACQSDAQCDGGCCVMKRNKDQGFCKRSPQRGEKGKCRKSCHCAEGLQCFVPNRMAKRGKTVGKCMNPGEANSRKGFFLTTPAPAQPTTEQ